MLIHRGSKTPVPVCEGCWKPIKIRKYNRPSQRAHRWKGADDRMHHACSTACKKRYKPATERPKCEGCGQRISSDHLEITRHQACVKPVDPDQGLTAPVEPPSPVLDPQTAAVS